MSYIEEEGVGGDYHKNKSSVNAEGREGISCKNYKKRRKLIRGQLEKDDHKDKKVFNNNIKSAGYVTSKLFQTGLSYQLHTVSQTIFIIFQYQTLYIIYSYQLKKHILCFLLSFNSFVSNS